MKRIGKKKEVMLDAKRLVKALFLEKLVETTSSPRPSPLRRGGNARSVFVHLCDWIGASAFACRWFIAVSLFSSVALTLYAQVPGGSDSKMQLAPAYPLIPVPFWEQHRVVIIVLSVLVVLCVGTLIWLWLQPVPPAPIPSEVVAREEIQKLSGQPEDGACLSRLSQIMRRYIITAFKMPAGELTTAEFCTAINDRAEVGPDLAGRIGNFLRECDARKFKPVPSVTDLKAVDRALELVSLADDRRKSTPTQMIPVVTQPPLP